MFLKLVLKHLRVLGLVIKYPNRTVLTGHGDHMTGLIEVTGVGCKGLVVIVLEIAVIL